MSQSEYIARLRSRTLKVYTQMFFTGDIIPDGYLRVDADGKVYFSTGGSTLPDQTGQNGKVLFTDGTDPYWGSLTGGGDMAKAVYDTNDDGYVDYATAIAGTPGNSKVYTTSGAGAQQWESQGTAFNKAFGTGATDVAAGNHTHSTYLLISDIDDTPVDTELNAPISSNWAYDHLAASNPHGVDAGDITAAIPSGNFLRDDGTWQPIPGGGDMLKADYDTNDDNIVDAADYAATAPWAGISGVPDMFTPSAHTHLMSEIDDLPIFGNAVGLDLGTGANTIAEGDHTHVIADVATLQDELDALTPVSYSANAMTVTYGTLDTGVVGDLSDIGGTDVNISEATGANPLLVVFDFVNVARMTSFAFYGYYAGGATHQINVEIYNVGTTNWDVIGMFGIGTAKAWYDYPLYHTTDYINAGAVSIRLRHLDTGINTHDLILDHLELNYGGASGGQSNYVASQITNIPSGDIAATNVQSAINELDTEKIAKAIMLANSIIAAVSSGTPFPLELSASTVPGRAATGNVTAMSISSDLSTASANFDKLVYDKAVYAALANKMTLMSLNEYYWDLNDITLLNVSTSEHGLVPKAPNNTNKVLDGTGAWVYDTQRIEIQVTDDATALTTGDSKYTWVVPAFLNGFNLSSVEAFCTTVSSSGTPEFQLRNITDSVDMLSTKLTIDINEYTSATAATQAVIDTTKDDIATGDRIAVDCDTAGTGTKGALVRLYFEKP